MTEKQRLFLQQVIVWLRIQTRVLLKLKPSKQLFEQLYNLLSKFAQTIKITFTCMNYGYYNENSSNTVGTLAPQFEPERFQLQLYHHVLSTGLENDISKLKILEVGCGRGGGSAYIARHFKPTKMVGLDLSIEAINFCTQMHGTNAPLSFLTGDAENLPFPDASFDVVINIESSHCYPDFQAFVNEVTRVLKPKGRFLYADFHVADAINDIYLNPSALLTVKKEDITQEVVAALSKDSQRKENDIEQGKVFWLLKKPLKNFAACVGSQIFENFRTRKWIYLFYTLQKKTGS